MRPLTDLNSGPFKGRIIFQNFLFVLAITARSSRCSRSLSPVPCRADIGMVQSSPAVATSPPLIRESENITLVINNALFLFPKLKLKIT